MSNTPIFTKQKAVAINATIYLACAISVALAGFSLIPHALNFCILALGFSVSWSIGPRSCPKNSQVDAESGSRNVQGNPEIMANQEAESFIWWRDPPLFAVLFLLAFVSGLHITIAAEAVRKWIRVPYLLAMTFFYATLLAPLWILGLKFYFWPLLIGSVLTMICLILPVVIRGREGIMDGGNFEVSTPAHLILMMTYLLPIYILP